MESLLTELAVAFVVRTGRPCWASRPARMLVVLSAAVAALDLAIPYLPAPILAAVVGIIAAYVAAGEVLRRRILRSPVR